MARVDYLPVRIDQSDEAEHRRQLAETINAVQEGRINSVGTVTLTANSATTTLSHPAIYAFSTILFMPTTANAAAAMSGLYVTGRTTREATLNHANNAQSDRTFSYVVLG